MGCNCGKKNKGATPSPQGRAYEVHFQDGTTEKASTHAEAMTKLRTANVGGTIKVVSA